MTISIKLSKTCLTLPKPLFGNIFYNMSKQDFNKLTNYQIQIKKLLFFQPVTQLRFLTIFLINFLPAQFTEKE